MLCRAWRDVKAQALGTRVTAQRLLSSLLERQESSSDAVISSSRAASQRLQNAVSPECAECLQQNGFVVLDGVFGTRLSYHLLHEIKVYRPLRVQNQRQLLAKSSIFEADLLSKDTFSAASTFAGLQTNTGFRTMLSLFMPHLRLDSQAIKLQYNSGNGGCFPIHFDSDEMVDSRRISAIVYLNHDWQPSHGGQIRLYPAFDGHVDIEPINDRLVLFSSCRMPHRVLPSSSERYCFSIWLSQNRTAAKPPAPLAQILHSARTEGSRWSAQALLQEPDVRRSITKLIHGREWLDSLRDSHSDSPARATVIANFQAEQALLLRELSSLVPQLTSYDSKHKLQSLASAQPYSWF